MKYQLSIWFAKNYLYFLFIMKRGGGEEGHFCRNQLLLPVISPSNFNKQLTCTTDSDSFSGVSVCLLVWLFDSARLNLALAITSDSNGIVPTCIGNAAVTAFSAYNAPRWSNLGRWLNLFSFFILPLHYRLVMQKTP